MTDLDPQPTPPVADRRPIARTHHGDTFDDPYEWLRAKDDAEVVAHLEAENAYTSARTAHLSRLRDTIFGEIKGRTLETDLSVPARRGDWWYYGRTVAGAQYGIQCRAPLDSPDDWTPPTLSPDRPVPGEQVLFDGNVEAEGTDFFSLGSFEISNDGTRMLYGIDVAGDERYTVRVRDLTTGETLADEIPGTFSGATFSPDGRFIVYTTVDDAWRPDTVCAARDRDGRGCRCEAVPRAGRPLLGRRRLHPQRQIPRHRDGLLHHERGVAGGRRRPPWRAARGVAAHGRRGVLQLARRGRRRGRALHPPQRRRPRLRTGAGAGIRTAGAARDGHRAPHGQRLLGVDTFRDWGVVAYRRDGLARLGMLSYADGAVTEIAFDEPLYSVGMGGNPEWAPPMLRLGYGSFVTPGTVFDYVIDTGELLLRKRQPVLGGFDPSDYGQARVWAPAEDGTQVPVSLVWKRSFGEPGTAARPVHLYGYGSYEHSIEPGFSVPRLSLLDRGVVFAVAHVRGGGEMGRQWYEDGKLQAKRNTFTDFVAAARHLVAEGYTTPDRIVAEGGSAGGLLMGAVANLAPEMFAGILADVPFVDALTTILDPSLPLTVIEWDEWGDPLHDADVYAYMKSYSPYENVRDGVAYPRILAVTSLNDTRVLYVEPAKWVQRLREVGADAMLKCEMVAGHGGVSGRYNAWRERAFELAWLLDVLGLAE